MQRNASAVMALRKRLQANRREFYFFVRRKDYSQSELID